MRARGTPADATASTSVPSRRRAEVRNGSLRARSAMNDSGYQVWLAAAGASQVSAGMGQRAGQFQDVLRRRVPPVHEDHCDPAFAQGRPA